jgi:hypothetical protein
VALLTNLHEGTTPDSHRTYDEPELRRFCANVSLFGEDGRSRCYLTSDASKVARLFEGWELAFSVLR